MPGKAPATLFSLSAQGAVPEILRGLAVRIERGEARAESFRWEMDEASLTFTARLGLEPEDEGKR